MARPKLERLTCEWCEGEFIRRPGTRGPKPRFCSVAHRQLAFEANRVQRIEALNRQLQKKLAAATAALEASTMRPKRGWEDQFHDAVAKLAAA